MLLYCLKLKKKKNKVKIQELSKKKPERIVHLSNCAVCNSTKSTFIK